MSKESKCHYCMVAVGAEGFVDIQNETWFHRASEEETNWYLNINSTTNFRRDESMFRDRDGRPYFLVVLHDDAPEEARNKAARYIRVKYLID